MTEPAADRPSLTPRPRPGPRNPLYAFLYHCVLSRNIIPSSHLFLSPSRCILRSCVIRPHAHPWPRTPAGQAAPPHIFRRCPPGCAHASGLLLTPPCAMRCEPALCCSIIASSRLTSAMLQRRSCSRQFASLRTPPPCRCLVTPVGGPLPSTPVRFDSVLTVA